MVLGLRSRRHKGASVQVDYIVFVQEIRPWPPSESLRSVQSVLLQWENGDQNYGSLISGVGNAKIEFDKSFTLSLTLSREKKALDKFKKNCLEFQVYETRKDKTTKGQLLGTATINVADYGIIEESLTLTVPVSWKKSLKNALQPVLFVKIQPIDKDSSNSSPKVSLSTEASLDKDGQESVSGLMNEENDVESEIASFTDDDVASSAAGTSPSQDRKNVSESAKESTARDNGESALVLGLEPAMQVVNAGAESFGRSDEISNTLPSIDLSSNQGNPVNYRANLPKFPERTMTSVWKKPVTPFFQSSASSVGYRNTYGDSSNVVRSFEQENMSNNFREKIAYSKGQIEGNTQQSVEDNFVDRLAAKTASSSTSIQVEVNSDLASSRDTQANADDGQTTRQIISVQVEARTVGDLNVGPVGGNEKKEPREIGHDKRILEEMRDSEENNLVGKFSQETIRKQDTMKSDALTPNRRALGVQDTNVANPKLRHVKSVQLPFDSVKVNNQNMEKAKKLDTLEDAHGIRSNTATERKEPISGFSDSKMEWQSRIEMLEEELREAAAIEVGLYSVVAEHGSSTNKVHAPARRLSRFYLYACNSRSRSKRASAARTAVSGFALVSKACGNDVPRLTFWLSNSIMLRAIISQAVRAMPLSSNPRVKSKGGGMVSGGRSPGKWGESSPNAEEKNNSVEEFDEWEDPETFTTAMEKVEAWIFSRIIESIWWQTLTPHMQSTAAKTSGKTVGSSSRKTNGSGYVLGNQEQGNFSVELWKKAFKDACERLCPIRAGGHECGCLPLLARLVMEQLVSRLDVAMFNAILRESDEEMPTDPVSDPITDSKVLPIPAAKSSFGAGAQLKNAIGNWSRWLTDLFGIEDNDVPEDDTDLRDNKSLKCDTSFKPFRLLNALSDLMMLPSEMLADKSTRKEVCPTFGAPVIKRVLNNFVPDEFCPDTVPESVLEALDSEDALEVDGESLATIPCIATSTVYSPPSTASLTAVIGEVGSQALHRSGSSVTRKSYTSDDELDELDSPLTSILADSFRGSPTLAKPNWMPKGKGGRNVVRYQLLREAWRDGEY